ncbi:MAG: GAF domain-containing protein, partial [Actinomycetota bacterium]
MGRNLYKSLLGRLSTKMAIGFIGIVAVFATLGVLILIQTSGARTSTGEAIRRFEAVNYLQDFTAALGAQTQAHYEFIFENQEDRLADFREAQQRRQEALSGIRERVETEEELRWLDEMAAAADAFDANFLNSIQSARRVGNREALLTGEAASDSFLKTIDTASDLLAADLYEKNLEVRRDVDTAVSDAGTQLLLASLIGIALSLVIATMATRKLIRPVEELKETCRAWSAGDIERRVSITSGDESAELGRFFNHMADSFQQKIGQLTRLSDIALAISSELDWDYVIDIVMQKGTELTNSQAAAIVLFDEEERKFTDVYTKGLSDHFVTNMSFRPRGLAEEALEGTAPAVFSDDVGAKHKLSKLCYEEGITAFMCLPLKVHQNKLGVFYVYSTEVAAFGHEEFSVLRILA